MARARARHVEDHGTRVRFTWACGTSRTKDYAKGPVPKRVGHTGVRILVRMWRSSGVTANCPKHGRFCDWPKGFLFRQDVEDKAEPPNQNETNWSDFDAP